MLSTNEATGPGEFIVHPLREAQEIAQKYNHKFITLEHFLYALLHDAEVCDCVRSCGGDHMDLLNELSEFFDSNEIQVCADGEVPVPTNRLHEVMVRAVASMMFMRSNPRKARPVDLLYQILNYTGMDSHAVNILVLHGVTFERVQRWISGKYSASSSSQDEKSSSAKYFSDITEASRFLLQFGKNLIDCAARGEIDPLVGRSREINDIVEVISRRTKNNILLVGEPGTGKTQIVEGLAKRIYDGQVPACIAGSIPWSIDVGSILAGTRYRGEFEERVNLIISALSMFEKPILFIDEIHTILGVGSNSQSNMDMANILKPALARGKLRCIGATTPEDFRKNIEKDRALLRRFRRLDIVPPTINEAKNILKGVKPIYEKYHDVIFTDAAIDAAVDLADRHIMGAQLPDKAIDVIDAAGAVAKLEKASNDIVIDVDRIEDEVMKIARIPSRNHLKDDAENLVLLSANMKTDVFGQDAVIDELTDAVMVSRVGLCSPGKPAGSYLFVGPTGTGKTQVAKSLAHHLNIPLVRFDMTEFQERHSISRLIGSPPGYVGFDNGGAGSGLLVNAIDMTPHCVLLLDEIEKAHTDLYNILLQVMSDGILTNTTGKTVSFRNAILIMTSNIGFKSDVSPSIFGFGANTDPNHLMDTKITTSIERIFSPEFRNRLDGVMRFSPLSRDTILRIVDKMISEVQNLSAEKGISLILSSGVKEWLATNGYDHDLGARPLSRLINRIIKVPMAKMIVNRKLQKGDECHVSIVEDKVCLTTA